MLIGITNEQSQFIDADQLGGAITEQLADLFDENQNSKSRKKVKLVS